MGLKYRNIKTSAGGFSFDSKAEASLYAILRLREAAGEISDIAVKPNVHLTDAKILCIPDFSYIDATSGSTIYAEMKGFETPVWRIKRRLWKFYGPGPLEVYMGSYKNPTLRETIIPQIVV